MKLQNPNGEQNNITEALQLELPDHAVISVTGAGGKSELISAWTRELTSTGKRVATTDSPAEEELEHLRDTCDAVLIEADSSCGKPLRWPAPCEPVIPDCTDITVYVAGLSAVGQRVSDVIYRADELPERLQRDIVDVNLLHALISSREGGRKGVRGEYRVFLNQVDDDIDRLAAAYRLQQILSVFGIRTAWGSLLPPQADV